MDQHALSDHSDDRRRPDPLDSLPDDASLPPVEPPSARFIVQLFVVPALIVAAVIGVYLLFGRLASSEVDWRALVVDLRSSNPHARWRGANGLAQLLEADAVRQRAAIAAPSDSTAGGRPLSQDPALATELVAALQESLAQENTGDEHQRLLEYLIKSLGWLDLPDVVLPALVDAHTGTRDQFLRQQALIAIGMVAGRAQARGEPVDDSSLTQFLLEETRQQRGVLRHLAIYDLGLLAGESVQPQLHALLADPDPKARVNAAVGVARTGSLDSLPVFESILSDAATQSFDPDVVATEADADDYFERSQLLGNALAAANLLGPRLSPQQRDRLLQSIEPLTRIKDADLRHKAITARHTLETAVATPTSPGGR